jgi:hypothetical protein
MTTKFPLSLLDIHYSYDRTVNAVRNRWMEKYLLVQLGHRAQMLTTPCGIEVSTLGSHDKSLRFDT